MKQAKSKHWERGLPPDEAYAATADDLVQRILKLIPTHPEILEMDEPMPLMQIQEFDCDDLSPTYFQAAWSLAKAKHVWKEKNP